MKTKYIRAFLIFMVVLIGCSEEFLDTKQQGVATVEDYYSTEEEILEGILGCYDYLQNIWINVEYVPHMTYTMLGDEVYCGGSSRLSVLFCQLVRTAHLRSSANCIGHCHYSLPRF